MRKAAVCGFLIVVGSVEAIATQSPTDNEATRTPTKELVPRGGSVVYASKSGAVLDSNLLTGGGSDDTAVLQQVLNRAAKNGYVHLIIDGPGLVSGLDVYGYTTIECTAGGGLYLKENSNRAVIRNAHRSRGAIVDEHIAIRGCLINGNRVGQQSVGGKWFRTPGQEQDGTFKSGVQFFGVNYLTLDDVILWNTSAFAVWVANGKVITIRNVSVDSMIPPFPETGSIADQRRYFEPRVNDDGLHFNGPIQYLMIDGLKVRNEDDVIGLNANDAGVDDMTLTDEMGPYVGQGPITDVTVRDVMLMNCIQGIRLLSTTERIDRVTIDNVSGVVRERMALLSHHINRQKSSHLGNFGTIVFNGVYVQLVGPVWADLYPEMRAGNYGMDEPETWDAGEEFDSPLFSINSPVEHLSLSHVVVKAIDPRPLIRVGREAAVAVMDTDMSIDDPLGVAAPLEVEDGGRVGRLNFALDWNGRTPDVSRNPIKYKGGGITHIHWLNTPPMYVGAQVRDGNVLAVTFTQAVKAADFTAGVTIQMNDKPVRVANVFQPAAHEVDFVLKRSIRPSDILVWAYEASQGNIQNMSGDQLRSISAKHVSNN